MRGLVRMRGFTMALLIAAVAAGSGEAGDLFGLSSGSAEVPETSRAPALPSSPAARVETELAEDSRRHRERSVQGPWLPTPRTLAVSPELWVARDRVPGRPLLEEQPPKDGVLRLRVSLTRVGPGVLLPGKGASRTLRPLPAPARTAAAQDLALFGEVDALRGRLREIGAHLVLARRIPGVTGAQARLPAVPGASSIHVRGIRPGAPVRGLPVVGGGEDAYWEREGPTRPAAELTYRRAVRTGSGRDLLFDEVDESGHPRGTPPAPVGIELTGEAFEALGLEGDMSWVVWWAPAAPVG